MTIPLITQAGQFDAQSYFNESLPYVLTPENLIEMKHPLVVEKLKYIHQLNSAIQLQELGQSAEDRSVNMLSFGTGDTKVLLWSQMHGDEPTATAGLLALFHYIAKNADTKLIRDLNEKLSIHAIVMLNPDGAERYQRHNAQGIDLNRDARRLQSPEAKILKAMNDQIKPDYGFNLHDMRGRETVGSTGNLLTVALMAPPFNKENEDNPSRLRAKQLSVIINKTLQPFIPGQVAKYKADYMPRAFGDAFQNWGVSTVLIESGLTDSIEPHHLVRLNFVLFLASFHAMANGLIEKEDATAYDRIPLEGRELFDLLIKGAKIYTGLPISPFTGDIGINIEQAWKTDRIILKGTIEDIGDLSIYTGRKIIEGKDLIVIPGLIAKSNKNDEDKDILQKGITSPVSETSKNIPSYPGNGILPFKDIPNYTSLPAQVLQYDNRGRIDIDRIADLLIFRDSGDEALSGDDLLYVIKNGEIVYQADE